MTMKNIKAAAAAIAKNVKGMAIDAGTVTKFKVIDVHKNGEGAAKVYVRTTTGEDVTSVAWFNFLKMGVDQVGVVINSLFFGTSVLIDAAILKKLGYNKISEAVNSNNDKVKAIGLSIKIALDGIFGAATATPIKYMSIEEKMGAYFKEVAVTMEIAKYVVTMFDNIDRDDLDELIAICKDFEYVRAYFAELSIDSTKEPPAFWYIQGMLQFKKLLKSRFQLGGEVKIADGKVVNDYTMGMGINTVTKEEKVWGKDAEDLLALGFATKKGKAVVVNKVDFNDCVSRLRNDLSSKVAGLGEFYLSHNYEMATPEYAIKFAKRVQTEEPDANDAMRYMKIAQYKAIALQNEKLAVLRDSGIKDKDVLEEEEKRIRRMAQGCTDAAVGVTRYMTAGLAPERLGALAFANSLKEDKSVSGLWKAFAQEATLFALYGMFGDKDNHMVITTWEKAGKQERLTWYVDNNNVKVFYGKRQIPVSKNGNVVTVSGKEFVVNRINDEVVLEAEGIVSTDITAQVESGRIAVNQVLHADKGVLEAALGEGNFVKAEIVEGTVIVAGKRGGYIDGNNITAEVTIFRAEEEGRVSYWAFAPVYSLMKIKKGNLNKVLLWSTVYDREETAIRFRDTISGKVLTLDNEGKKALKVKGNKADTTAMVYSSYYKEDRERPFAISNKDFEMKGGKHCLSVLSGLTGRVVFCDIITETDKEGKVLGYQLVFILENVKQEEEELVSNNHELPEIPEIKIETEEEIAADDELLDDYDPEEDYEIPEDYEDYVAPSDEDFVAPEDYVADDFNFDDGFEAEDDGSVVFDFGDGAEAEDDGSINLDF